MTTDMKIRVFTAFSGYDSQCFRVRIRKLTPLECFRLMGVYDDASRKMMAVNSKSQCYKQAGNSIVVDNLHAIMEQIFYPTPQPRQTTIFDFI